MKKISTYIKSIVLSFVSLAMIFGVVVNAKNDTYRVNAESTTKVYSNDFYTLSYSNDEVKLLLNADLTVYKDFSKQDLKDLKDAVVSVGYSAVLGSFDLSTGTPKVSQVRRNSSGTGGYAVDISQITDIVSAQLDSTGQIDEALNNGAYDVILEYYVDRYVDVYLQDNPTSDLDSILTEIDSQLTVAIQSTIDDVYESHGWAEFAPDASSKIDEIMQTVADSQNGVTGDITVSLPDVERIIEIVDDKNVIVDVIKDLEIESEIKTIVTNSSSDEVVDFLTNVDMDTIINVFENVAFEKEDVKDMIANIGIDNLIDVVDTVGADKIADLANAVNLNKNDVNELIKDNVSNISIASLLKSIKNVKVDGVAIYEDSEVKFDGLTYLVKSLPRPADIANYTDEQMRHSWTVSAETVFGDFNLKLTVGFKGNCSYIRTAARELAEAVDVKIENGVYYVEVKSPAKVSDLLLRLCNTGKVSDDVKLTIFNNAFSTVDEVYNKITDRTFEHYLELLKDVDYQLILANLYNAENLNKLFNTSKFTDARLDALVDEVCNLVSKAANWDYDRIKEFVGRYYDISALDDTQVEELVNKAHSVLQKIDRLSLDSKLLREFIDPDSIYTNDNVDQYIDKLANYEGYFDKAMSYVDRIYNAAPDRFKDNSILDFYKGNGKFNYTGAFTLDYEKVLNKISSEYGPKIYEALEVLMDRMPSEINVSLTFNISNVYKVTYHTENTIREGMLPVGADLAFFADTATIGNYNVEKWVDANGVEYTTMPAKDIELYPITEFNASILEGVNKVYDGQEEVLEVYTDPANTGYTYQWYKDGVAIAGATSSTYKVVNVADSGSYYCEVSLPTNFTTSNVVDVVINKAIINADEFNWEYAGPYTYTGNAYEVSFDVASYPVTVAATGDFTAVNAGSYTANVEVSYDEANYEMVGTYEKSLDWAINQYEIDADKFAWVNVGPYTYTGNTYTVAFETGTDLVTATVSGDVSAVNAGRYTANVALDYDTVNYKLTGSYESQLVWDINKVRVDASEFGWDYTSAFTYNGNEHVVNYLTPDAEDVVTVVYESANKAVNAGTYTTVVTLEYDTVNYELVNLINNSTLIWNVNKVLVETDEFEWIYNGPYTYDGTEKSVKFDSHTDLVSVLYVDNVKTNAGTYTAKATVKVNDAVNYELNGESVYTLSWTINKAIVDTSSFAWDYVDAFTYDGTTKSVELDTNNEPVSILYVDNAKTNAGSYFAKATVKLNDAVNYELVGNDTFEIKWVINRAVVDANEFAWDYTDAFTYNGNEQSVNYVLTQEAEGIVTVHYVGNQKAKDSGTYRVKAVLDYDVYNYELINLHNNLELSWEIKRAIIHAEDFGWDYDSFDYNGYDQTVNYVLTKEAEGIVTVHYVGTQTARDAGTYKVKAILEYDSFNCELINLDQANLEHEWTINRAIVDASNFGWDYTTPFTYDGQEHEVKYLTPNAEGIVTVTYVGDYKATNAGFYTAVVNLSYNLLNCELINLPDNLELQWVIEKYQIAANNFGWDYTTAFDFDGQEHTVKYETGTDLVKVSYTENSVTAATNAGAYTAEAVLSYDKANYELINLPNNLVLPWTINKVVVDASTFAWDYTTAFDYDGQEHTVKYETGTDLVKVSYTDNSVTAATNAGAYTAEAVLSYDKANYELINLPNNLVLPWKINKVVVDASTFAWDYTTAFDYDGQEHSVAFTTNSTVVTATVSGDHKAVNAGTYVAYVTLSYDTTNVEVTGTYEKSLTWTINKVVVDASTFAWDYTTAFDYDGQEHSVAFETGSALVEVSYKGSRTATNAGTYEAIVVLSYDSNNIMLVGQYNATLLWTIEKGTIDADQFAWTYAAPFEYNGSKHAVELETNNSAVTVTYEGTYEATDAGTYNVEAKLSYNTDNYRLVGTYEATLTWVINKHQVDAKEFAWTYTEPFEYNGSKQSVDFNADRSVVDVTITGIKEATNAGTYTAHVSVALKDSKNYELIGSYIDSLTWKINKVTITVTDINWDYTTPFTYDGNNHTVKVNNLPAGLDYVYGGITTAVNAGTYKATITISTSNSNYEIFGSNYDELEWTIEKATISVNGVAWDYEDAFKYNGSAHSVSVTGLPQGVAYTYGGTTTATDAGTYKATITLNPSNSNYELVGTYENELEWVIEVAAFDLSTLTWDYVSPFTYKEGTTYEVKLVNVPSYITVTYHDNSKSAIGNYTAYATAVSSNNNYQLTGEISSLTWEIKSEGGQITTDKVNYKVVLGDGGTILVQILAENHIIDETSSISFVDVTAATKDRNIDLSSLTSEGQIASLLAAYDISFVDAANNTLNYQDNFTVTLIIPRELRAKANLKVVHIADDGTIEDMNASRDANYMVFTTTHFSNYAIVEVVDENDPTINPQPVECNHWWLWLIIGIEALIIIILLAFIFLRKKEVVVIEPEAKTTYLVNTVDGVKEMPLRDQESDDVISEQDKDLYAIGTVKGETISIFKNTKPVNLVTGKDKGEAVSIYKRPVHVLQKDNEEPGIVELGEVVEKQDTIVIRIFKNPKDVE